jgi:hypothetical protein
MLNTTPRTRPLPVLVPTTDDRFTTGLLADIEAVLVSRGYPPATDADMDSLSRAIGGHLRRTGRSGTHPADSAPGSAAA